MFLLKIKYTPKVLVFSLSLSFICDLYLLVMYLLVFFQLIISTVTLDKADDNVGIKCKFEEESI